MEKYKKALKNYVNDMQKAGYPLDSIKQQLNNHGHAKHVVEETITEVEGPKKTKKRRKESPEAVNEPFVKENLILGAERVFIFLYIIGVITLIFWLSAVNNAPFSKVFIGFTPTIISIILVILVLETQLQKIKAVNLIIPIITSIGFYVLAMPNNNPILTNADISNITVANFILSIAFVLLIEFMISSYQKTGKIPGYAEFAEGGSKKTVTKRKTSSSMDLNQNADTELTFSGNKKQFEEYIQAIEDKCKAINFVIGRVYSNKRGGSPKLRDSIKINPEWYNTFSEINDENIERNMVNIKKVLWSIYDRLLIIGKKETEVFRKKDINSLAEKSLVRDKLGEETIIEVMTNNDKDPVMTYYQSAVDFCNKATEELRGLEDQ